MAWIEELLRSIATVGPLFAFLVLLVLAIGVPAAVGSAILGPINRAAGRLKAPTRFQLSDFLWLLVQVQIVLGYCVEFVGVRHLWFFVLMLSFLGLAVMGMWAGGVSFLSRAGVSHPPRRAVFLLFLLPLTLAVMMSTTIILVVTVVTSTGLFEFSYDYRTQVEVGYQQLSLGPMGALLGVLALPFIGYGLRRVSLWVVRDPAMASTIPPVPLPHPLADVQLSQQVTP